MRKRIEHKFIDNIEHKWCNKCKAWYILTSFNVDHSKWDNLKSQCKQCFRVYSKTNKAEYYKKNKQIIDTKNREWARNNPNKCYGYVKSYVSNNRGKVNCWNSNYRATKLQATPSWLTQEQLDEITSIYVECDRITKETGIKHEVDHIIPLQGVTVRGLHVPWNLQIIRMTENRSKSNNLI